MTRLELGNELNVDDSFKVIQGPFAIMYGKIKIFDFKIKI